MKTHYNIIILSLILTFSGCADFLDEEPKSLVTSDHLRTEQGMYDGVAGTYSFLRDLATPLFSIQMYSDIWDNGGSGPTAESYTTLNTESRLNDIWKFSQQAIANANAMIDILGENPTEKKHQYYLGEMKALRSYFFWINVEFWGRYAHYQDKVSWEFTNDLLNINQQPVEVFYKTMWSDINYAIDHLPTKENISEKGRVGKASAQAMKARFLLSVAGYANSAYQGQPEYNLHLKLGYADLDAVYKEARDLANDVIVNSGYRLLPNWNDIWDGNNENNDEILFAIQWTTDETFNNPASTVHRPAVARTCETIARSVSGGKVLYTGQSPTVTRKDDSGAEFQYTLPCHSRWYGREYRHMMPTLYWIKLFDTEDARLRGSFEDVYYRLTSDLGEPVPGNDTVVYMPFREVSMAEESKWLQRGIHIDGLSEVYDLDNADPEYYGGPRAAGRSKYHSFKKTYDRLRDVLPKQDNGYKDGILFRIGEMYLVAAECAWRLGEGDQAVYNALRPLWKRAGMDDGTYEKPVNLDYILDEYARELGGEYERWFILKRTRSLVDRILMCNPKSKEDKDKRVRDFVKEAHYLKPIPYNQKVRYINFTPSMEVPGY